MKHRLNRLALTAAVLLAAALATPRGTPAAKRIVAYRTPVPPVIDGIMDECWADAPTAGGFRQKEPLDGVPATRATEVKVMYDDQALYFFFTCYDDGPEVVIGKQMRRDAFLRGDDTVEIYLDTFNDQRNLYYFRTNPLSAREDAVVSDGGSRIIREWNGIWKCRSRVHGKGWNSEIAIPWRNLRYPLGDMLTIGMNLGRTIRRKQEETYWSPIPRDLGRFGCYRAEYYGKLVIPDSPARGRPREIKPYILGGIQREFRPLSRQSIREMGLDLKSRLTPNMTLDLTLNTDFAQVEADEEVVNLTRFSLFFPEKRDFFLEGAAIFDVGASKDLRLGRRLGIQGGVAPFSLFYSRRIGIYEGNSIPILGGGKLTGKAGPYSLGILDIVTDKYRGVGDDGTPFSLSRTNFGVIRVKRDLFDRSSLGFIVADRSSPGAGEYNRTYGVDGGWFFGPNLSLVATSALTSYTGSKAESDRSAHFGRFSWRNDLFHGNTHLMHIGKDFNPGMGFVRRENINNFYWHSGLTPRLNRRGIRNVAVEYTLDYTADTGNKLESREHELTWWLRTSLRDRLAFYHRRRFEFLAGVDSIRSILLQPGIYRFGSNALSLYISESRPVSGYLGFEWGDFYSGRRTTAYARISWKPLPRLIIHPTVRHDILDFPGTRLNINTIGNRLVFSITPDLYLKSYIQYNDYDNRATSNFLVHWIYRPGSDIYLVYNEFYDSPGDRLRIGRRTLMLKLTCLY